MERASEGQPRHLVYVEPEPGPGNWQAGLAELRTYDAKEAKATVRYLINGRRSAVTVPTRFLNFASAVTETRESDRLATGRTRTSSVPASRLNEARAAAATAARRPATSVDPSAPQNVYKRATAEEKGEIVKKAIEEYKGGWTKPKEERITLAKVSKRYGIPPSTFNTALYCGGEIGKRGRKPVLADEFLDILFFMSDEVAAGGSGWNTAKFCNIAAEVAQQLTGKEVKVPTVQWFYQQRYRFTERHGIPVKNQRARAKNAAKSTVSTAATVKAYFTLLQEVVSEYAWPNPECPMDVPTCPAHAIICWDEVGSKFTADQGQGRKTISFRDTRAEDTRAYGKETVGHFTTMLGFSLSGHIAPAFCVFQSSAWTTTGGRLRGVPADWRFTWTDSGSMTASTLEENEEGEKVPQGPMLWWAQHVEENVRRTMSLPKGQKMIHILDQCTVHQDPYAAKYLVDHDHVLIGAPKNTTHFLQVGDRPELNRAFHVHRREQFQKMVDQGGHINNDNVADIIQKAVYSSISSASVKKAAAGVGFNIQKAGSQAVVDLSDGSITSAVQQHARVYQMGPSTEILTSAAGLSLTERLRGNESPGFDERSRQIIAQLYDRERLHKTNRGKPNMSQKRARATRFTEADLHGARVMSSESEIQAKMNKRQRKLDADAAKKKRALDRAKHAKWKEEVVVKLGEAQLSLQKGKGGPIAFSQVISVMEHAVHPIQEAVNYVKRIRSGEMPHPKRLKRSSNHAPQAA